MGRLGWHMMQNDTNIGEGPDEWEDGIEPGIPHLGSLAITATQTTNLRSQWQALSNAGAMTKYPATMNLISNLITQGKAADAQANLNSVRGWVNRDTAQSGQTSYMAQGTSWGTSWLDNIPWTKILIGAAAAGLIWWAVKGRKGK